MRCQRAADCLRPAIPAAASPIFEQRHDRPVSTEAARLPGRLHLVDRTVGSNMTSGNVSFRPSRALVPPPSNRPRHPRRGSVYRVCGCCSLSCRTARRRPRHSCDRASSGSGASDPSHSASRVERGRASCRLTAGRPRAPREPICVAAVRAGFLTGLGATSTFERDARAAPSRHEEREIIPAAPRPKGDRGLLARFAALLTSRIVAAVIQAAPDEALAMTASRDSSGGPRAERASCPSPIDSTSSRLPIAGVQRTAALRARPRTSSSRSRRCAVVAALTRVAQREQLVVIASIALLTSRGR